MSDSLPSSSHLRFSKDVGHLLKYKNKGILQPAAATLGHKKRGQLLNLLKSLQYDGSDLDNFHVNGVQTFLTVLNFIRNLIVLADLIDQS